MRVKVFGVLFLFSFLWLSCEHDPFPAPPTSMANDTTSASKPCHPDTVYFNRDVLPILSNCAFAGCHDPFTANKGVILDNYTNTVNTADVVPGDPDASDLYEVITETDPAKRMPPGGQLSQTDTDLIRKWILQGAQDLTCDDDCDTVNVSFMDDINPIFATSCATPGCHSGATPAGGVALTDHAGIANATSNGEVIARINHQGGLPVMPPSGIKLEDCKLKQIDAWVRDGLPNN